MYSSHSFQKFTFRKLWKDDHKYSSRGFMPLFFFLWLSHFFPSFCCLWSKYTMHCIAHYNWTKNKKNKIVWAKYTIISVSFTFCIFAIETNVIFVLLLCLLNWRSSHSWCSIDLARWDVHKINNFFFTSEQKKKEHNVGHRTNCGKL